jgi:hypothetical protein
VRFRAASSINARHKTLQKMASNKQINKEKTNGNTGTPKPKEFATNAQQHSLVGCKMQSFESFLNQPQRVDVRVGFWSKHSTVSLLKLKII